jgi:hypothetical protein
VKDRFIAFDMMTERINPEEPSKAAGDYQQLIVQDKAHGRGRESGVCIQQRDDCGHVRAADGDYQQDSEDYGDPYDDWKKMRGFWVLNQIHGQCDSNRQHPQVDDVLPLVCDGALGQDLLQLSCGHQTSGESQASENYFG